MDKQAKQATKRPRVLTLCMLAAAVGTLSLAGCGNGDDDLPPAQQPETMEQDPAATNGQEPTMDNNPDMNESAAAQDPAMNNDQTSDPGLGDEAASSQEPMPAEDEMTNDPEEEPGFGEGTDPMPGADEDDETADEQTNNS